MSPDQASGVVNRMVDVQAYTLAVNDLFLLSAVIFLLLVLMLWMTKPQAGGTAGAAGAH
jgi:DHA2 family multidrug resistance protein